MHKISIIIISILISIYSYSQHSDTNIFGDVQSNGEHIPFVNIYLKGTNIGTTTDETGHYLLIDLPVGKHILVAQMVGYKTQEEEIELTEGKSIEFNFKLIEDKIAVDEIVVTGTKTFKRQTDSPVIVNVIDSKIFEFVQANTISDGLCFQPGLRMETDCQTCNYTQLRMNGLGGAYSQILINSRPIFSALTGLYGLEQIPTEMVDRIEVVRGGGSALYGSSAIGGTVNVITKFPDRNAYDISMSNTVLNGQSNDNHINGTVTLLTRKRNAGASIFVSRRERESYDHDGDGYSEMPELKNNSFGFNSYFKLSPKQKLEINMASLHEYRYGGQITDKPAYLAQQSEERVHDILMGGLDYSLQFDNNNTNMSIYLAAQNTKRKHYTGIIPDDDDGIIEFNANPPYGNTDNSTYMGGIQVNHILHDFIRGINTLTLGMEYNYDDTFDEIEAYDYIIDQQTKNFGAFVQSDWALDSKLTLLTGLRADKHNFVDRLILNPRVSVLYKLIPELQYRLSWSQGFRAPQAFDADMHIAFAGGGIQKIQLANNLTDERSQSISTSFNYDKASEKHIYGFTVEGFYTLLKDAFVLEELSSTPDGNSIMEKRNGGNSEVFGGTLEFRMNYNRKFQVETGITIQKSQYGKIVNWSEDIEGTKDYLRTPNSYGYYTITFTPESPFMASLSGIYTGSMKVPHYGVPGDAGTIEQDEVFISDSFLEVNLKLSYSFNLPTLDSKLELFAGMGNMFNAYQDDFDTGKNRDSNYVYGPGKPKNVFVGIKIKN